MPCLHRNGLGRRSRHCREAEAVKEAVKKTGENGQVIPCYTYDMTIFFLGDDHRLTSFSWVPMAYREGFDP